MITLNLFAVVVLVFVAMFVIIAGIGHLFNGDFDTTDEDIMRLRNDIRHSAETVSAHSSFNGFIAAKDRERKV